MAISKTRQLVDVYTHDEGLANSIFSYFSERLGSEGFREEEGCYNFFDIPCSKARSFLKSQEKTMPCAQYEVILSHSQGGTRYAQLRVFLNGAFKTLSNPREINAFLKRRFKEISNLAQNCWDN